MIGNFCLMDPELLRDKILHKLKEKGLNIGKAEKLAGMRPTSLRSFMNGRTSNPTLDTLRAVSQILEMDISEIITERPKDNFSTSSKIPWNNEIYLKIVSNLSEFIINTKLPLPSEEALSIIRSIYYLCLENNNQDVDKAFIEWLLKKMAEQN